MLQLAVLMLSVYVAFVFFSETLNPFSKPKMHVQRSRWRYGRRMALAVLVGGLCAIVLIQVSPETLIVDVVIGVSISLAMAVYVSIDRIRQVLSH